jgi:hypothetical protein
MDNLNHILFRKPLCGLAYDACAVGNLVISIMDDVLNCCKDYAGAFECHLLLWSQFFACYFLLWDALILIDLRSVSSLILSRPVNYG